MDVITAVRELGKAIQADERYIKFNEARKANDEDAALQQQIGEFNLIRMQVSEEMNKDEGKDEEKIKELNKKLRKVYADIMVNDKMAAYNQAKNSFDELVRSMNTIIDKSIAGDDPDTCDWSDGCSGNCASCGGCH